MACTVLQNKLPVLQQKMACTSMINGLYFDEKWPVLHELMASTSK